MDKETTEMLRRAREIVLAFRPSLLEQHAIFTDNLGFRTEDLMILVYDALPDQPQYPCANFVVRDAAKWAAIEITSDKARAALDAMGRAMEVFPELHNLSPVGAGEIGVCAVGTRRGPAVEFVIDAARFLSGEAAE